MRRRRKKDELLQENSNFYKYFIVTVLYNSNKYVNVNERRNVSPCFSRVLPLV